MRRSEDFLKLWVGQTVSQFGSMITGGALPLTALLVLNATPAQMGLLAAMGGLPVLFVSLFAGVWVDHVRRRPILIVADVLRAVLLATIPAAAFTGILRIELLYVIAALAGALTVLFEIAQQSYLPTLVAKEQLVDANSKLGVSDSIAEIGGNALGGVLVQLVTAPLAILLDAISYIFSAISVWFIRTREPAPTTREHDAPVWHAIGEGVRVLVADPRLRALTAAAATANFFGGFFGALYTLFVIRELQFGPAVLGILVGAGGIGALFGALATAWFTRRLGAGRVVIVSLAFAALMQLLTVLAGGPPLLAVGMLLVSQIAGDVAWGVHAITERSLRQALAPRHLLGRINASHRFVVGGIGTLGLLVGGLLAEWIGVRATLWVTVPGMFLAGLWVFFSPLRNMRHIAHTDDV
ncbi:MAG TPA: MFS transporter [Anaerolineae bacterium]